MWYAASVYFESVHTPPDAEESIWEHRIILLDALDEATLSKIALDYGKKEEHDYLNAAGEKVIWKFNSVDRIQPLDAKEFAHGLEIHGRFLKSSEVASLKTPFDD